MRVSSRKWIEKKTTCWSIVRIVVLVFFSDKSKAFSSLPGVVVVRSWFVAALVSQPVSCNILSHLQKSCKAQRKAFIVQTVSPLLSAVSCTISKLTSSSFEYALILRRLLERLFRRCETNLESFEALRITCGNVIKPA